MSTELDELLSHCREKARVCPMPQRWSELWEMRKSASKLAVRNQAASLPPDSPVSVTQG